MFSLSTSWNSSRHDDGFSLVEEIKQAGFDTIELGFALTEKIAGDILSQKNDSRIMVSSLHNICPLPAGIEPKDASPDHFSMAAADESMRKRAVAAAKNTISWAKIFGATAVVLHTGRVDVKDKTRRLAAVFGDKGEFETLKHEMTEERNRHSRAHLDSVIASLGEIIPFAEKMGIKLGVENRFYYREIPLKEELGEIFRNFKSPCLCYWHDTGHAEVFERLGLARHKDLLESFSNRLLGMHLHDIIGILNDHNAPGTGTFDFKMLRPYIKAGVIMVIEAHSPLAGSQELRKSVDYLKRCLYD